MAQMRKDVAADNAKANIAAKPNFSHGYGGKFGVQTDRQDKVRSIPLSHAPPRAAYACGGGRGRPTHAACFKKPEV